MFTLKVGTASTYQDIDAKETRIVVPFEIVDEAGAVVNEQKQSFPLATTEEEITAALHQALTVYTDDHVRFEAGKAAQAGLEASEGVTAAISNITITQ
jgi:hypothetical protein